MHTAWPWSYPLPHHRSNHSTVRNPQAGTGASLGSLIDAHGCVLIHLLSVAPAPRYRFSCPSNSQERGRPGILPPSTRLDKPLRAPHLVEDIFTASLLHMRQIREALCPSQPNLCNFHILDQGLR